MEPDRPAMNLLDDGPWSPSLREPAAEPIRHPGHRRPADPQAAHPWGSAGMADPLRKRGAMPPGGDGRRGPPPAAAQGAPAAMIQDLRRLRQWALERLDSLEAR